MLLSRWIPTHRQLRCALLLRDIHATHACLRKYLDPFQIDPITAKAGISSRYPKNNGRKSKKIREGRRKKRKTTIEGRPSTPGKLSSLLRLHDNKSRYTRSEDEGAFGLRSRTLPGRLSRNKSIDAQLISDRDLENKPRLPSLLHYSRRVDGVIQPRTSSGSFLEDVLPPSPQSPIATLEHGLDRVLFNPGVQWLQDPRSQVYGFTTWLEKIIPVKNFAFERLPSFLPSSRDQDLYAVVQREGRKYAGSTSSTSGLLGQLYYLISGDKRVDTSNLSSTFTTQPQTFTPSQRMPASVILNYRDGVYLIDSAGDAIPGMSGKNILTWMGTLLEKHLTHSPDEFLRLTRSSDDPVVVAKEPKREAYRYAKSDKFVLRSQLDCFDPRLPGTGVFDIKTRAVMTIRHDLLNFEENSGYQIRTLQGLVESFEKEYYDLIRSAFLKYNFQARIGNMDGVFVAYHNTERIFGFQYIPLSEMDARLFGEYASGDAVFEKCLQLLEVVLEEATRELPQQSIRLTAQKLESEDSLSVFVEPADPDEGGGESRPVILLNVSTKSYIGEKATDGPKAVKKSNSPWTILWSVSKSTLDHNAIRDKLAAARKRSSFPLYLPTGVGIQEMEKVWHELQFNPVAPSEVPFKAEFFRPPSESVQVLRRLSRNGRDYLKRTMRERQGRPKFVLGLPNDAQQIAPLVALAHGARLEQDAGGSDSGTIDNMVTTTRYAGSGGLKDVEGTVRVSDVRAANIAADASEQQTRAIEPTIGHHVPPLVILEGGDDIIPKATLTHLEEMLSEDQRGIIKEQGNLSAVQSKRVRAILSRHGVAGRSKSRQLTNHSSGHLREAHTIDGPGPAAQEECVHSPEGKPHKAVASSTT